MSETKVNSFLIQQMRNLHQSAIGLCDTEKGDCMVGAVWQNNELAHCMYGEEASVAYAILEIFSNNEGVLRSFYAIMSAQPSFIISLAVLLLDNAKSLRVLSEEDRVKVANAMRELAEKITTYNNDETNHQQ